MYLPIPIGILIHVGSGKPMKAISRGIQSSESSY